MFMVEESKETAVKDGAWPAWSCPEHALPLTDLGDCLACPKSEQFARIDGIPRFVLGSTKVDAFGLQWERHRKTQLDSYTGTTITRDRLQRCLGEPLSTSLKSIHVLEAGCGAGRFTEILLGLGARVTSVDLSTAVDVNQENCRQNEYHRVAQADILRLPFAPQKFDVVVCLGVVQHIQSLEKTIAALYDQVKPGGCLVLDHYAYNLSWYTKTAPLFRWVLRRMPPERGMAVTEWLVRVLLPWHRSAARHLPRIAQMMLSRLSPVLCYYRAYPQLSEELQREWALLDTHDYLTDSYKRFSTSGQIRRTLERLGLVNVRCERVGATVEARGQRSN